MRTKRNLIFLKIINRKNTKSHNKDALKFREKQNKASKPEG